ncbi:uncharacterized protein LOC113239673 [Hyposmocoma kahamanoa]|uniref:uncharacterized protein LOC113239673 n=1 Tax=Hyposmocoma kahamanoa TaxID=1477025 RepID=UPI000E6D5B40|nr:uncharacterized protein LOC113239673 [Hyposmocoma kahamanoa]
MYCDIPDFGRCCLCLPLRKGILIFGYINVLYSAFMVGLYSYWVHHGDLKQSYIIFHGVTTETMSELILFIFCVDVVINCLLVYGAHQKVTSFLKVFYYYTIMTCIAAIMLEIIEAISYPARIVQDLILSFAGLCIQLYLLLLVRSLLRKLEIGNQHNFDNQLHNVVTGENTIYNNCTVIPNDS